MWKLTYRSGDTECCADTGVTVGAVRHNLYDRDDALDLLNRAYASIRLALLSDRADLA